MGLKDDIYQAFEKNLGSDAINATEESKKKVDDLAKDLRNAIINFIVKQEFNITEMEAPINILPGEIQTSGGVSTPGAPGAPVSIVPATPTVNIIPLQKIAQISETSNKIMDPRVPTAVKKSKVKLLNVKEA